MNSIYITTDLFSSSTAKKYFKDATIVSLDDVLDQFEQIVDDLHELQEKFDELKQDVEDNYRPISKSEQIDWNENW